MTDVPRRPNELPTGTPLRMRLREEIATDSTRANTPFAADLSENVMNAGRVVLPAGSTVEGTVTHVRGGKRFHGAALIHLQPQTIVLPDGTRMPLRAAVIDTDQYAHTKVDEEGNILRKDHVGATLAAMSLTTGGAAAAGAVLGGGVGALVGAGCGRGRQHGVVVEAGPPDASAEGIADRSGVDRAHGDSCAGARAGLLGDAAVACDDGGARLQPVPAYVAPQSFVPTN